MKIHFLGTGHGVPEKDRYCSCSVVTVNSKLYVIDAGISLYSALVHNGYDPKDVNGIFITHMHGDHVSGLVEFIDLFSWAKSLREFNPSIFVPTLAGKLALGSLAQAMDQGREVQINVYAEGVVFEDENVKVTAFKTKHNAASHGFLLEAEGKRVYFTGDMIRDISDCPEFLYNEKTDLVICESAHNRLPEISDKFNSMKTEKIIINHIAPKHSLDEFSECKPLVNKPFILSYDGMTTEV